MKKMRTTVLAGLLLVSVGIFAMPQNIITSCGTVHQIADTELLDNPDAIIYILDQFERIDCGN